MIFTETSIAGAFHIDSECIEDARGFFARTFCEQEMRAHGLEAHISQCSVSWNRSRGTLRGMHYQDAPHQETKIVRCTRGAIWDVILDLRPESRTFMKWFGNDLTAGNRRLLYIPRGVAHGFITLDEDTEVFYQIDVPFVPEAARGVLWNDPEFAIEWPLPPAIVSARDRSFPRWKA